VYAYASQVGVCAGISAHVCSVGVHVWQGMYGKACVQQLVVGTAITVHLSVHMRVCAH
jgi:hypothetical protein